MDRRFADYVFERHGPATVERWAAGLRYFAFHRAFGGHANDGDELRVDLRYTDGPGLLETLARLGVEAPRSRSPRGSLPVAGLEDRDQPGWVRIAGDRVFVYVHRQFLTLSVAGTRDGNLYEVSEDDYLLCRRLEQELERAGLASAVDRAREASPNCVSRRNYPELFPAEEEK